MQVKFFATYRQVAGCKTCRIEAPRDVRALLGVLTDRWPEFRTLLLTEDGTDKSNDVLILVNGHLIAHLDGLETKLSDKDAVAISPVIGGG